MQSYPSNLQFASRRLTRFSREKVHWAPQGPTTAGPNTQINCTFPVGAFNDLDTYTINFLGTTSTTGTGFAAFPKNIESLIQQVDENIGGQALSSTFNYNQLFNTYTDHHVSQDAEARRGIMSNGKGNLAAPTANVVTPVRFSIASHLDFIGTAMPRVIDTSLMNPLQVRYQFMPASALDTSAGAANVSYAITDIYFTIDTISIQDGALAALHQSFLLEGNPLPITYKRWVGFQNAATGSGSFTTNYSSGSINNVVAFFTLNSGWDALNTGTAGGGTHDAVRDSSTYFTRPVVCNFPGLVMNTATAYFQINGKYYPGYPIPADALYTTNLTALRKNNDTMGGVAGTITTAASYLSSHGCFWLRLNNTDDIGWMSGYDSRGNTMGIVFNWAGGTFTPAAGVGLAINIFIESTEEVKVYAGKQLDVGS